MFRFLKTRNYVKSNRITKVKIKINPLDIVYAKQLIQASTAKERQFLGTQLLNNLNNSLSIEPVTVKISDIKQFHKRRGTRITMRQYGYYRPASRYIYITNRTAARGQILAPKTFANTLLHEWMHHYDIQKLRLNSIHTAGFYARLKDITHKLEIV